MSLVTRLYPHSRDSLRRRQFRALIAALIVGLVCAVVLGVTLYLVYSRPVP